MRPHRISIGLLMRGIVLLAIPFAMLVNSTNGRAMTGANRLTDMGLWPGMVVFSWASMELARRRSSRTPFLWGFAVAGWVSLAAYVLLCLAASPMVEGPILFYWNDLGECGMAWLTDWETYYGYLLNLMIMGLMLATPQLMMATLVGWIARWAWGFRWTTT
jgi:hypothetical protein